MTVTAMDIAAISRPFLGTKEPVMLAMPMEPITWHSVPCFFLIHPGRLTWNPKNGGLEDDFSFFLGDF